MSRSELLAPTSKGFSADAPPPSYSESVNAPPWADPVISRVDTLIDSHISPYLYENPSINLVIVPSNVANLIPAATEPSSHKKALSNGFPNETLVGFPSEIISIIVRLSGSEHRLEFWQRTSVLRELNLQLRRKLSFEGHRVVSSPLKAKANNPARIAGSKEVDWRSIERTPLSDGEARASTEVTEVCLRIENELGLYETRSGKALVVKVEFGVREDDD
ncbi:MAG: hypothetical protein LQ346_003307 [Caloplaca aetnensis]|nr:MAG: hypothetical protein LQ346_003307 [Caloplaca aetnensis]